MIWLAEPKFGERRLARQALALAKAGAIGPTRTEPLQSAITRVFETRPETAETMAESGAEELECLCIKYLSNHLQLRKVIATTKGAQSPVEFGGFQFRCSKHLLPSTQL